MTDTHTHLYMPEFADDGREAAVERAIAAGVTRMVFPNVDAGTAADMIALHRRYPEATRMAMGLHPTEVRDDWQVQLGKIRDMLDAGGYVAIGEVGIDLYWDRTYRDEQMEVFRRQLRWAKELSLPVTIHCRDGLDETLECIEAEDMGSHRLLFHSFTGSPDDADRILAAVPGAMFGINGVVTFKNANEVRHSVSHIGIGRILLETDSPYLAPVPHRGQRNESAYLPDICRKVAETLGMTADEVEQTTDRSANRFFAMT